ncbi:MAG: ATP-binding protein [Deltaproteobacteria bacterium]|nr:ATP-binding protein [Deltaproteobacteria bacterium]
MSINKYFELDPNALDVARHEDIFIAYYQDAPLKTPSGLPISHRVQRVLEHLTRELALAGRFGMGEVNTYTWFTWTHDLSADNQLVESLFCQAFAGDCFAKQRSTREQVESLAAKTHQAQIPKLPDIDHPLFAFLFSGLNRLISKIIETVMELAHEAENLNYEDLLQNPQVFRAAFLGFTTEKQAALLMLSHAHLSGFILPFLLIDRRITASEYANGVFLTDLPNQHQYPQAESHDTQGIPIMHLTRPNWQRPSESFAAIHQQASGVMELLTCLSEEGEPTGILELIRRGEDFNREFKSTLRRNLHTQKNDQAIEHACLKTICAFLNSNGGSLLIGVRDDGSIEGIETDSFPGEDRFAQHLWNLIKTALGLEVTQCVRTEFEKIDHRTVCLVSCSSSRDPVFLKFKNEEEFYIRVGPSSASLGLKDTLKYIEQRFQSKPISTMIKKDVFNKRQ